MIIFFYPYKFDIQNGANRRIEFLSKALKRNGTPYKVVSHRVLMDILTPFENKLFFIGLRRLVYFLYIYRALKDDNVKMVSEVVFAPTWLNNFFLQVHDLKAFDSTHSRGGLLRRYSYHIFIKLASNIIVVSKFVKREISEICHISPTKITTIPNGIDNHRLDIANTVEAQDIIYDFIYVSGFAKHKRHDLLIKALPAGSKLCLIGQDLGALDSIIELIKSRNGDVSVDVLNSVTSDFELFSLIASSRYCVFTSSYEGFGIPILEYLLLNKYIVASKIPAFIEMSDIINEFFDVDDLNSLQVILDRLYKTQENRSNDMLDFLYHGRYSEDSIARKLKNL